MRQVRMGGGHPQEKIRDTWPMAQNAADRPPQPELRPDQAARSPLQRHDGYRRCYAALDLGTNNCRLLVARPAPEGFIVIDAFSRVVRLGEGLALTGRISD